MKPMNKQKKKKTDVARIVVGLNAEMVHSFHVFIAFSVCGIAKRKILPLLLVIFGELC